MVCHLPDSRINITAQDGLGGSGNSVGMAGDGGWQMGMMATYALLVYLGCTSTSIIADFGSGCGM